MKVLLVEPGQKPRSVEIENSLEAKQTAVGGLIEVVSPPNHPDDAVLICNEEGKLIGLKPNRKICLDNGTPYDIICGTFFICRAPADSEGFEELTEEQIALYTKMYS